MAELRSGEAQWYFLDASPQSERCWGCQPRGEIRPEGLDVCVVRMEKHINER